MPPILALLILAYFILLLVLPDNAFFTRGSLTTPEARCLRPPPFVGMPELLAPCGGVSVLLAPKRGILGFTLGKFLTTDSSLPLAEILTADLLVATGPLNSVPELPAPSLKYFS
jgi:hypothetical protein